MAGSLAAFSIVWGLLAAWVFHRFTNHTALRRVRKVLYAHLLEIRLFAEEPGLVWKAQKAVVADNLRFLWLIAKPVLILGLPFALLYTPLDSIYGWAPLEPGHTALVTLQTENAGVNFDLETPRGIVIEMPRGIVIETPPVRVAPEHQISWRVRAVTAVQGTMRIDSASIPVVAGDQILAPKHRHEATPGGGWVEVDYPKSNLIFAGISLPWLVWFMTFSTLSGMIFAKTFFPRFVVDKPRIQA